MTQRKAPRIFSHFSSNDFKNSVVHYAHLDLDSIEFGYATAAQRLGDTMNRHDSFDDLVLIPYMFLWRHAIELSLKNQLRFAIKLRAQIDVEDARLDYENVSQLLERKHNLSSLFNRLKGQFQKLQLPWFDQEHVDAFHLLADSDTNGQSFRYAGTADNEQSHIDFGNLSDTLNKLYQHLSAGMDVLEERQSLIVDEFEEESYINATELAELEAEMKADYEAELREYTGKDQNGRPT